MKKLFPLIFSIFSCVCYSQTIDFSVNNTLSFAREEIISIPKSKLALLNKYPKENIRIRSENNVLLPIQWVDNDLDGDFNEFLFEAKIAANSKQRFFIIVDSSRIPTVGNATFCRFVPERSDDFAWENDKVAFRVYGPKGQEEAIGGEAGSTLSSGIDIWLKKVSYPIINKWYKNHVNSPGYYHTDHGEGYDPYHVGGSRGNGGSGIWKSDSLYVSKNFTDYKIITIGPLRAIFELKYAAYGPTAITETKRISIDKGSNFSKIEIHLNRKTANYTVGISLHNNKGLSEINSKSGTFRHWESIDDSFVGEGIVMNPSNVKSAFNRISKVPDQSNLLIILKPTEKFSYYVGFAWQKSNQVSDVSDWDELLERQSLIIANPLEIKFK